MIIFLFITQNYKITYFSNKPYFYHFFFKKKKIRKKKWQNIFLKEKNIIMNQEESQNTREKYLTDWQAMLIKQEIDLVEKQTSFKLYEADLFKFEDSLKEVQKEINDEKERLRNFHCICCRFNKNLPLNTSDTVYVEWATFKREKDREVRLGTNTSIGEMYSCQTFFNLFCKWLEGDVRKNFKHKIQLVACYVTKLELSWTADDWRLVDDLNTKLITCEKSGRCKIKFIVIC